MKIKRFSFNKFLDHPFDSAYWFHPKIEKSRPFTTTEFKFFLKKLEESLSHGEYDYNICNRLLTKSQYKELDVLLERMTQDFNINRKGLDSVFECITID